MQTILNLLVRLQEVERMAEAARAGQLTQRETRAVQWGIGRLHELIPPPVLTGYENVKQTEADLRPFPELMAMAALLSAFHHCPPQERLQFPGREVRPTTVPRHQHASGRIGVNGTCRLHAR